MISINDLYPNETKAELLERLYPEKIQYCDYALPQNWIDAVSNGNLEDYDLLLSGTVWNCESAYSEPLFLLKEAHDIYQKYLNKA